ncbi:MAG: AsmA-like C-terminal region-containing protein, partial [Candidatus Eiseniibacteriota bacterium]
LEDVDVTAVRNEQGLANWEGLGGKRAAAAPKSPEFDLSLRRLDLKRARARSYDARSGAYYEVQRADAVVALKTTGGGRDQEWKANARLSGIRDRKPWPIGSRPIDLSFEARSEGAGARWTVKRVSLERGALKLAGHGTVEGPERVLDFALDTTTLPVKDLLEVLPRDHVPELEDLSGDGTIRLALQAKGPVANGRLPQIRARAQLTDGRLTFARRKLSLEGLAFDLAATEQGADLKSLTGRVGRSQFAVSGVSRDWVAPRVRAHVSANLDLADVAGFLPLADSTKLAGTARAELDGAGLLSAGTTDALDFGWSGRMALANVSASGLGLGYPVTGVNGDIGLSPGRAWATGLTAQLGRSDVTVDGTVERPFEWLDAATGRAARPDPNAVAHFALRSRVLDGDQLVPARPNENPLPRVRAEGTIAVGSFKFRRFAATNLLGRVRYVNGVTTLEDATCDAYRGRMRGTGWFDLSNRSNARYVVHATADGLDANELLSAWTPAKNLAFGTLQMSIDLDGKGLTPQAVAQSLSAKGLAQILGGRLAGSNVLAQIATFTGVDRFKLLSFRDLAAPFRVVQGRVVFDPIAVTTGGTDWLAQGSVGIDGTLDFRVGALVPPNEVRALPSNLTRTAGALLDPGGRLSLDMIVDGTVQRPRVRWDADRTASRLVSNVQQQAVDQLAKMLGSTLGDSLDASKQGIEAKTAAIVEEQQKKLVQEVERQKENLANRAVDELTKLFNRPAPPPAPPPPDTTGADTTRVPPASPSPPPAPAPAPAPTPAPTAPTPPDTGARAPADSATRPDSN